MADDDGALHRVALTAHFLARLGAIENFLAEADPAFAFDALLEGLRGTVVRNLARFPRMGRRYLDQPPRSSEALALLRAFPVGAAHALRQYPHGDYLILYTAQPGVVTLLSIRHHRELSFDLPRHWDL